MSKFIIECREPRIKESLSLISDKLKAVNQESIDLVFGLFNSSHPELKGAEFHLMDLSKVNFSPKYHLWMCFDFCTFRTLNFSGATVRKCCFDKCEFICVDFSDTFFDEVTFYDCRFVSVDFTNAGFSRAKFLDCHFESVTDFKNLHWVGSLKDIE